MHTDIAHLTEYAGFISVKPLHELHSQPTFYYYAAQLHTICFHSEATALSTLPSHTLLVHSPSLLIWWSEYRNYLLLLRIPFKEKTISAMKENKLSLGIKNYFCLLFQNVHLEYNNQPLNSRGLQFGQSII